MTNQKPIPFCGENSKTSYFSGKSHQLVVIDNGESRQHPARCHQLIPPSYQVVLPLEAAQRLPKWFHVSKDAGGTLSHSENGDFLIVEPAIWRGTSSMNIRWFWWTIFEI